MAVSVVCQRLFPSVVAVSFTLTIWPAKALGADPTVLAASDAAYRGPLGGDNINPGGEAMRAVAGVNGFHGSSGAVIRSALSMIPLGASADEHHRLRLSDFTVVKKGNPLCEDADGTIRLVCSADQAMELYHPRVLTGDSTATCRFAAVLPKVWINVPQAMVGLFLRPTAPEATVYPDAKKIIYSNLTTAWADSGSYIPGAKVNNVTGSMRVAYLQQKKEYEFYFRIVKRSSKYSVCFSRNGMNWITLAEGEFPGADTSYCGMCLSAPAGARKSSITLKGFFVVTP